ASAGAAGALASVRVMSGVARPRGPLPARVYWVRRLLVAGVVLGLVFGIRGLLDSSPDDTGVTTARQVGSSAQVAESGPTASAGPDTDARGERRRKAEKPKKTPLPAPTGVCLDTDVTVTPRVEGAAAGGGVAIALDLTSSLSVACTWRVSPRSVVVRLSSGNDRIWTSQDCARAMPTEDVVVRRDTPATVTMTWNGRRSDAECSRNTAWALPGYYHVAAAAYGGSPTEVQFQLRTPQAPVITKTAKPKPKAKESAKPESRPRRQPSGAVEPGDDQLQD
ncbi:MAG: hypothetical protein Q8Q02_03420, partial [Nocardioides sp.]|nr:hypothetical protein [Nocardioides sp.]